MHTVEDLLHVRGGGDVVVCARGSGRRVAAVVEEVDVDSVLVVPRANGRDGGQGLLGFFPPWPEHAGAVVDDEDGVELAEEGVG